MNPMLRGMTPAQLVKLIRGSQRTLRDKKERQRLGSVKVQKVKMQLFEAQDELRDRLAKLMSGDCRYNPEEWIKFRKMPVKVLGAFMGGIIHACEPIKDGKVPVLIADEALGMFMVEPEWYAPALLSPAIKQNIWTIDN